MGLFVDMGATKYNGTENIIINSNYYGIEEIYSIFPFPTFAFGEN